METRSRKRALEQPPPPRRKKKAGIISSLPPFSSSSSSSSSSAMKRSVKTRASARKSTYEKEENKVDRSKESKIDHANGDHAEQSKNEPCTKGKEEEASNSDHDTKGKENQMGKSDHTNGEEKEASKNIKGKEIEEVKIEHTKGKDKEESKDDHIKVKEIGESTNFHTREESKNDQAKGKEKEESNAKEMEKVNASSHKEVILSRNANEVVVNEATFNNNSNNYRTRPAHISMREAYKAHSSHGNLTQILSSLTSEDEGCQLTGLTQLCEMLSMGTEDSLSYLPIRAFVTELVRLLTHEYNPEVMLLAARALTHLCDALPYSCSVLVNQGGIPHFCRILRSIQYIDLAEQSLQALAKISREHPAACLQAGALTAVLSNFEFYSTGVQRASISTAANMCRHMPPDASTFVTEAIPVLTNLLQYPDTKVIDHASVCLARIAESFASSSERLDMLCSHGLIAEAARLISVENIGFSQTSLNSSTYTGLVRTLSICVSGSTSAADALLRMNISSILKDILVGSGSISKSVSPVAMNMSTEQLREIVNLVNALIPPLPQSSMSLTSRLPGSSMVGRKQSLCIESNLLAQFGTHLFPILVQLYESCINLTIRYTCLDAMHKLVHFIAADVLYSIFQELNISSFLASVLVSKDPVVQITTLQIADLLMQKLPDYFSKAFVKEGVLHAINCQFDLGDDKGVATDISRRRSRRVASASNRAVKEEHISGEGASTTSTVRMPSEEPITDVSTLAITSAKSFKDTYFPVGSANEVSNNLKKMKKLSAKLIVGIKKKGENIQMLASLIAEILTEIGTGDISTFEFISCGVVESLLSYFSDVDVSNEELPQEELRQKLLRRLHQFITIATCNEETKLHFTMLVRKIQNALSSLESFPVNLTQSPSGTSKPGNATGLSILAQPLKLRFLKLPTDTSLQDFPTSVVLINPLTTLSSLEEFLWPRVRQIGVMATASSSQTPVSPSMSGRPPIQSEVPSTVSKDMASGTSTLADQKIHDKNHMKKKNKIASLNQTEEHRGPETRNAAAKRRNEEAARLIKETFEAVADIEDSESDLSLVEEEGEYSSDEEDEYWDEEFDQYEQARMVFEEEVMCDGVYEVQLGDECTTTGVSSPAKTIRESEVSSFSRSSRLCFSIGGKPLDRNWTIFEAIQQVDERFKSFSLESRRIWHEVHHINYQHADSLSDSGNSAQLESVTKPNVPVARENTWKNVLLNNVVEKQLPCDMDKSEATYNVLLLLYILDGLNRFIPSLHDQECSIVETDFLKEKGVSSPLVPHEEFFSTKLIPKMTRQLQDAMALCSGKIPSWCHDITRACPFLLPFETKRQYFYLTALGLPRAVHHLQQQQILDNMALSNDRLPRIGRLQRRKVRIYRDRILESARKVMEVFAADKGVLEVEYFGEVGIGLGPTLEFYTLLSHELQKDSLGMWRTSPHTQTEFLSDGESRQGLVNILYGLFPRPLQPRLGNCDKTISSFRLLGQVIGKALQDGRLLDLPLATPFYKLMLDEELGLYDIKFFDLELGKTLEEMQNLVERHRRLKASTRKTKQTLCFRGQNIEDLYLDFTLPGYPGHVLKPGGEDIMVSMENLEEYITLVVDNSVKVGITHQMRAFREGFEHVFSMSMLRIFNEEQLSYMLCGRREMWLADSLMEHVRFDHGYNASSLPVRNLLEIMGEFTPMQQRAFLRFVTGAPQLPCGGLSALHPKLTIVCKHPSGTSMGTSPRRYADLADHDLPSVMTCANYLKLPPYSSKEIMKERLLYAIHEGQGSFDLS